MAYLDDAAFVLNIQPIGLPTIVRLSQNENGRRLYFTIIGNETAIPSGVTVTLSGTKPDGVVYSKVGSISNGVVLINEDTQLTAAAGNWDAKIKIVSGGQTVATGRVRFIIDADPVAPGSVPSDSQLEGLVAEAEWYAENARSAAYGSPLIASTVAGMTDHTRVYVYTGSETGYTAGNWYYWNGSAWTSGGVYNSTALQTDTTLAIPGMAADAKATGDAIDGLDARLDTAEDDITDVKSDLDNIIEKEDVDLYTTIPALEETLFTIADVKVGDEIAYDILMPDASLSVNKSGFIALYNSSNVRTAWYGRGSMTDQTKVFTGTFTIADDFAYAKWQGHAVPLELTISRKVPVYYGAVSYILDQTLTDDQKEQAQKNIGVYDDNIIFHGSVVVGQTLFTSDSVTSGNTVYYDITVPTGYAGFLEFLDANNQRLSVSGKLSSSGYPDNIVSSVDVPEGYAKCVWGGTGTGTIDYISIVEPINSERIERIENELDIVYKNDSFEILDGCTYTDGYTLRVFDGYLDNQPLTSVTGYIPVIPGSRIYPNWTLGSLQNGVGYYDSNKVYINGECSYYNEYYTVPENASYIRMTILTSNKANVKAYCQIPLVESVDASEKILNPFERYSIKNFGTLFDGMPHCGFPNMCLFNGKMYVIYRCGLQHVLANSDAFWQVDTITFDGQHEHIKTFTKSDFSGISGDMRDAHLSISRDGKYLILSGGTTYTYSNTYDYYKVIALLDENADILNYKVFSERDDYTFGGVRVTPSGHILFTTFTKDLQTIRLYRSNEVFTNDVSTLTFGTSVLFTATEGDVSGISESCLGYFNDKLVCLARVDENGVQATLLKWTSNLEGTSGWSNIVILDGMRIQAPQLLPYYKGKYLLYMGCWQQDPSLDRPPYVGYIDVENGVFVHGAIVDNSLFPSSNGYPGFVQVTNNICAVVYFQESPNMINQSIPVTDYNSFTAIYYKWIALNAIMPELVYGE